MPQRSPVEQDLARPMSLRLFKKTNNSAARCYGQRHRRGPACACWPQRHSQQFFRNQRHRRWHRRLDQCRRRGRSFRDQCRCSQCHYCNQQTALRPTPWISPCKMLVVEEKKRMAHNHPEFHTRRPRRRRVARIEWEADRLDFRSQSLDVGDDCMGDNRMRPLRT